MTAITRAEHLVGPFAALDAAVIAAIAGRTDEAWRRTSVGAGWPLGTVAHHIAVARRAYAAMVAGPAAGATCSRQASWDEIDRDNARHAREYAHVGKPETLAPPTESRDAIGRLLRPLGDAQLDRTAGRFGARELSVAGVMEGIVIAHAAEHLASIRATLAG